MGIHKALSGCMKNVEVNNKITDYEDMWKLPSQELSLKGGSSNTSLPYNCKVRWLPLPLLTWARCKIQDHSRLTKHRIDNFVTKMSCQLVIDLKIKILDWQSLATVFFSEVHKLFQQLKDIRCPVNEINIFLEPRWEWLYSKERTWSENVFSKNSFWSNFEKFQWT